MRCSFIQWVIERTQMKATLNSAQVATMLSLRSFPDDAANAVRTALFKAFKDAFGIPDAHKVSVDLDNVGAPTFGMIVRKKTGLAYGLNAAGKWDDTTPSVIDPVVAPAAEVRWFLLDDAVLTSAAAENNDYFRAGNDSQPDGHVVDTADGAPKKVVDSDGNVWVGLTSEQFGNAN